MLTKVTYSNREFGTVSIKKFSLKVIYDLITDNLEGLLLVKTSKLVYIYNTNLEKKILYNRISIYWNDVVIWKQIESFDQNNPKISTRLRDYVMSLLKSNEINILGIGGEFYVYYKKMIYNNYNYKSYIGISNHETIIQDANFNLDIFNKYIQIQNILVDYSDILSYPKLDKSKPYDIIINLVNIHENIIKYISELNCRKIIIIMCKPLCSKIKMLNKYLTLKNIRHFLNINSWITICEFTLNYK